MLIAGDTPPTETAETGLRWWSDERFVLGWKGHIYVAGEVAGAASMPAIARLLEAMTLGEAAQRISGVFGLFVHDRRRGGWQITIDHAGLYKVFHDAQGAATGFLELLQARPRSRADVPAEALLDFLQHGYVAAPDSFVRGVRKLRHDEVLELEPGAAPRLLRKTLVRPADDGPDTVLAYFRDLARSMSGERVSVDVTGGFDSRLIACMLAYHGLDYEIAITGRDGAADIELARNVAAALGRPFFPHHHDIARLEEELETVFRLGDGQHEIRGFHRDWQNARARLSRGVQVIAHGGGGDMFKDFQVVHDFPRYNSPRIDLERYYDLRLAPLRMPMAALSPEAQALVPGIRSRMLARMAEYRAATNNRTFDQVSFYLRDPEFFGRYYSNYINLGLDVVAPYLDWRNAAVAHAMSPWRRMMNRWHRAVMTRHCPKIAALPTTDGYTASSELRFLVPNLLGFARNNARRIMRKSAQRLLGRTLFEKAGVAEFNAADYLARLRASAAFGRAVGELQRAGVLARDLDPAILPDHHVPRLLTAGMFLEHLAGLEAGMAPGGERRAPEELGACAQPDR
jgi:asparagine synthetase B (glutamine-hydrolysing)